MQSLRLAFRGNKKIIISYLIEITSKKMNFIGSGAKTCNYLEILAPEPFFLLSIRL